MIYLNTKGRDTTTITAITVDIKKAAIMTITEGIERYFYLFENLKNNKKLLVAISVVAIVMFILVVSVIIMFFPLIIKFLGTLQKSGISGLIETLKPLLELFWNGTGK